MRLIASALILTLLFSTLTYGVQSADAINPINGEYSGYQPKGTVCDADGNCVEIEIGENGTATTTTPETKPAEPEECDQECKEHEEMEQAKEQKDEDFETGEETATKAGQTVKDVVSETVKGVGNAVNDKIEEEVEEAVEEVACANTRCLIEKRQAEELKAWEERQGITEEDKLNTENGTATVCSSTACFMKQKHAAELKAYEESLKEETQEQAEIYDSDGNVIEQCDSTACFMKQRHANEIKAYEESLKESGEKTVVLDEDGNAVEEEVCTNTACLMKKKQLAEQLEAGIDVGDCKDTACLLKRALGLEKEYTAPIYTQDIFTITLSNSCLQAHKNNVTTICPTYEDLIQFDNTNHDISGKFVTDDNGFFHRELPKMDKHCKFYLPEVYSIVIVVDPDDCWIKERGGFTIKVNAIAPKDFKFKITNVIDVDKLRTIQKQDTRLLNEEQQLKDEIDRLEDIFEARDDDLEDLDEKIADFDKETRELYEEIGQNPDTVKIRDEERRDLVKSLNNRSYDRQLKSYQTELNEARLNYTSVLEEKRANLEEQRSLKGESSLATINGTYIMGVERSYEECRNAQVGAEVEQVAEAINYMLDNCEGDPNNTITTEIDQTPIGDLLQFTEYKFQKWFREMSQACLGLCKEY